MALPYDAIIYSGEGFPPSEFEGGRARRIYPWLDHEYGPIARSDNSQSITYQIWTAEITNNGTEITISAENTEPYVLLTGSNFIEVSISFDIIGNLYCVFEEDGVSKVYWYDVRVGDHIVTAFDEHLKNPRLTLDDKYDTSGRSDLILAYIKNHRVHYRIQRDRFEIEYLLESDRPATTLHKIGMGINGRVQFITHNDNEGHYYKNAPIHYSLSEAKYIRDNISEYTSINWLNFIEAFDEAALSFENGESTELQQKAHNKLTYELHKLKRKVDISSLESALAELEGNAAFEWLYEKISSMVHNVNEELLPYPSQTEVDTLNNEYVKLYEDRNIPVWFKDVSGFNSLVHLIETYYTDKEDLLSRINEYMSLTDNSETLKILQSDADMQLKIFKNDLNEHLL